MSERQSLLPAHTSPANEPDCLVSHDRSSHAKWRSKTAHFLESEPLRRIVVMLIAVDAACVLANLAYTVLSPECGSPGEQVTPVWLEVLSHMSFAITTLFLIEIPLTLWSLGIEYINPFGTIPHATLHAFDTVIIATTFTLEVILRGREKELSGLLIILRLWRLVQLAGGVAVGAGELSEEVSEDLARTQSELEETKARLAELENENIQLRSRLSRLGQNLE